MSYDNKIAEDARLFILKELSAQVDGHLNEIVLRRVLDMRYGIDRAREWVQTQLRWLEGMGVVEISGAGEILIGHITRPGRDFLAERTVIAGITPVSEIE